MLVSYGDVVLPGMYTVSSTFTRVINYTHGKNLVSLVLPEVGRGPLNIVLRKLPSDSSKPVVIKSNFIEISGEKILLENIKKYDSRLHLPQLRSCSEQLKEQSRVILIEKLKGNLNTLKEFLNQKAFSLSYAFILWPERKRFFKTSFEKALVERVERGWNEIVNKRYKTGVELIKGTGIGFTPSGDDFIAGILSGLYFFQEVFNADLLALRKIIYTASRTDNVISDSYAYCTFKGHFSEKVKELLQAMGTGNRDDVERNTLEVLSFGTTSGADFLTGVVASLNLMLGTYSA